MRRMRRTGCLTPWPMPRCALLAATLRRRFAPRTLDIAHAPMRFARRAPSWSTSLRVNVRLALARVVRAIGHRARTDVPRPERDRRPTARRFHTLVRELPGALPGMRAVGIERWSTRILERCMRREDPPRASTALAAGAAQAPALAASRPPASTAMRWQETRLPSPVSAVPMVVARTRPTGQETRGAPSTRPLQQAIAAHAAPAERASMASAISATAARGEPIGALADEVIRTIDRRIAAHRERFGRA